MAQSARVEVRPKMFRWAIDRARLDADDLLTRFPKLADWLGGDAHPTLRQLEDFAGATMAPLGYFFLSEPPTEQLTIPDFRTVKDRRLERPSPNLLDTLQTMQRRQAWLRDDRVEQGLRPLSFVRSTTIKAEPAVVANAIRKHLNLVTGWADVLGSWTDALRSFRDRVEDLGVVVIFNGVVGNNTHRKLDPEEFRGFVLVDEFAPLIFVNGNDAKAAQMFTLAHELAHIWIGQDGVFNLPRMLPSGDEGEVFCNKVAAEILIPSDEFRNAWMANRAPNRYAILARKFKVSEIVVARRALDMKLIQRDEFFDFYDKYIEREKARPKAESGGDFYLTQNNRVGRVFGEAVGQAVRDGRLLYREAFALTGLQGATFEKFIKGIGG